MENKLFDFNQFPEEEGLLLWGISMSRISNIQNPENCFKYLQELDKKIRKTKGIGGIFLYSDYLYFNTEKETPEVLKNRFLDLMAQHRNGFLSIIEKRLDWIPRSFTYITMGQLYLDNSRIFNGYLQKLKKLYKEDELFQKYVSLDIGKRGEGEGFANFFLEESLVFYLGSKGLLSLRNDYVSGHEKWVLNCYPGKPLRTEAYLYQKNPFNLNHPRSRFENHFYDLEGKILYDLTQVDLEIFNFDV